jgi:hypothetical protein
VYEEAARVQLFRPVTDLRIRRSLFHPLRIRHAVRIACSEPSRLVQFVQRD